MKKAFDIKKLNVPNFNEPKGEAYKNMMADVRSKVDKKRAIKNNSINTLNKYRTELNKIKHKIIMAEDEHEEMQLKAQRKELKEMIENVDDYSTLDVNVFAKKLIDNKELMEVRGEALKEYQDIVAKADDYFKDLEAHYLKFREQYLNFKAAYRSSSSFREADARFNQYKNNS